MKNEHELQLSPQMQQAIAELKALVSAHYPDATFRVSRSPDDEQSIDLVTTVDVQDRDEVVDVVIDRVLALQIEDNLPIHVVPIRPRERTLAMLREQVAAEERYAPRPVNQ